MVRHLIHQSKTIKVRVLGFGTITVAFRQSESEWLATALQFDIVGTGETKFDAFYEMQELVNAYLSHVLKSEHDCSFFNPSDREEWNNPDKKEYFVVVALVDWKNVEDSIELRDLRGMGDRVEEFELVASC